MYSSAMLPGDTVSPILSQQGIIFDIQRFAIHDGPGIRTTVFLKGCPLHCLWCHNPESQETGPEIFFSPEMCIACRYCEQTCQHGAHHFENGVHIYDLEACIHCGDCTRECYAQALEVSGKSMSIAAVLDEVMKDRDFYHPDVPIRLDVPNSNSLGGMTVSGGEPLLQFEFTRELLRAARQAGLHNCVETSGCGSLARYLEILPDVDLFLYDIKETDPHLHKLYTGVTNQGIIANLLALDQAGATTILRCPIIPGLNDREAHFQGIAHLAVQMQHLSEIHVLPYHALGVSKSQRLGKVSPWRGAPIPDETQVQQWVAAIQRHTTVHVRKD